MSGILRSFDKLISQCQLAKSGHKFLLKSNNATLHPTAYYYQKGSSQRLANDLDVFQLGLATAALTRQAKNYSTMLEHVEQESVRAEIQERLTSNLNEINTYFGEIISLFKIGRKDCPIQTVADISFVLADGPLKVPNATTLIAENLLSTLNEKLQYASVHNLQDILTAFVKLNYVADKELLKRLLTALSKKDFPSQLESVSNHGWTVDQYDNSEASCTCNLMSCTENSFEKYISQGGVESTAARARFAASELWDQITFNFINPIIFRERRINHRFAKRSVEHDNEVFLATLSKLSEIVPEASETIAAIKAKL